MAEEVIPALKLVGFVGQLLDGILDPGTFVIDCLTDLRHYCDTEGLDFADCDRMAYNHYRAERGGE